MHDIYLHVSPARSFQGSKNCVYRHFAYPYLFRTHYHKKNGCYSRWCRPYRPLEEAGSICWSRWYQRSYGKSTRLRHCRLCIPWRFRLWVYVSSLDFPINVTQLTHFSDNQGMFGQILTMTSFANTVHPERITNPTSRGFLTAYDILDLPHAPITEALTHCYSILELGAWFGVLVNGIAADRFGRKLACVGGVFVFLIGVIIQACAKNADYILGGRFVTGLGVGTLSMVVPL